MSESEVKVKVSADGATQAAAGVDKLTASLEKQRKTQEMIAATSAQIRKQNVVDALKQEAAAINGVTAALQKNQQAASAAAQAVDSVGVNSQELRRRLSPAAALVGNLSNQLSVLVPEAGGASKALQVFGMAGSQMLGVLGGGPGVLIGGLVAGIGALATYMASSKKEADELAKSVEANAKAMGTYLDQVDKLRASVSAKYDQAKNNKDIRSRILSGEEANPDAIAKELEYQRERLKNPYYRNAEKDARALSLRTGDPTMGDALLSQRKAEARAILDDIQAYKKQLQYAKDSLEEAKKQKGQKLDVEGAIAEAGGVPEDPKEAKKLDVPNIQSQIDKITEMEKAGQDRLDEYIQRSRQGAFDQRMLQLKDEVEASNKAIDEKYAYEAVQREKDAQAIAVHQQKLHADRKMYQDLAVQGEQILASTAIKSFQMIAKGQKAEVGAILEGLGDQIVAMGTGYIFKGIAESILLNPQGPALIGVGTAAVGFGVGLGAIGARGPGGSTAAGTGSAGSNANPFGSNPYSNPQSPVNQQDKGPTIININMPTVVSPSPEDGVRIQQALDAKLRVYGK